MVEPPFQVGILIVGTVKANSNTCPERQRVRRAHLILFSFYTAKTLEKAAKTRLYLVALTRPSNWLLNHSPVPPEPHRLVAEVDAALEQ